MNRIVKDYQSMLMLKTYIASTIINERGKSVVNE
jgi:hypothetical protein